jgi:predicted ATPase/DNA-binding SARP family transcriptional activator
MDGKITYHQQVSYCGKPRCHKCQEGIGHGPYWYAYKTVNGRTSRIYIGKRLPPDVQVAQNAMPASTSADVPGHVDFSDVLIRIFTLGRYQLERRTSSGWQSVTEAAWLRRTRTRALLALLICSPGRSVSRTRAIELLWSHRDKVSANEHLDATLQSLRKLFRHPQEALLYVEGEQIILAGQDSVWVDADAFTDLLNQCGIPAHLSNGEVPPLPQALPAPDYQQLNATRVRLLREALALYEGDFIPEAQHISWVGGHTKALRQSWVVLMLTLADLYRTADTTATIEMLNRLLAYDPANEAAVQRLMEVLAQQKRRGEALRAYQRLVDVLRQEYGTGPSETTRALAEAIRRGQELSVALTAPQTPVPAHMPLTTPALPSEDLLPLWTGRTHQRPLIGREQELQVLHDLLSEVKTEARAQAASLRRATGIPLDTQRRPQCVVLVGDAGIGKTRLAEEVSRDARRNGWAVIWSRAYAQESGVPYRLWIEVLRRTLTLGAGAIPGLGRALSDNQQSSASSTLPLYESLQPLLSLVPELGEVIPYTGYDTGMRFTPEQEQRRLWEAVRELFIVISEHMPLVIVLDDIQWTDASSCELLGYLARSLNGYPIFFVTTCRDAELPDSPPHPLRPLIEHMLREHSLITLTIEPLSSEQIGELVAGLPQVSESMIQYIQEHASGNPFFAEEMARTASPTLPKTIAAALEQRIRRLSEPCQRLLGNAAILGGSFEFPLICAIESGSEPANEDTILTLLEEALQSGVLTEEGSGTRITYHFWHPLLVEYLYNDVSATRRLVLHKRVARVLQEMYQGREDAVAAMITHHLVEGGADPAQIAHYAELAGNRAYSFSANAEAVRYYWLAAEQLGIVEPLKSYNRPETTREATSVQIAPSDLTHHIGLLERLAECVMIRGDFAEARYLYECILTLRNRYPASDALYEAQMRALLWCEIGRTWRYAVNSILAWQCCERAEQVLRAAHVIGGPAWARIRLSQCHLYMQEGRYDEAQQTASEALALLEKMQQEQMRRDQLARQISTYQTRVQRILDSDPAELGNVHRLLGDIANCTGQLSTGLQHLQTALAIYEEYHYKREIAHVECNQGYIYLKKAEYTQAEACFRRALSMAESIDDDPLISVVLSDRGEMAAARQDFSEAALWYQKALALAERIADREYLSLWNAALAIVYQKQQAQEEAKQCITRALIIGRATGKHPCIGVALVALSNIRIMQAQQVERNTPAYRQLLRKAQRDVQRALSLSGLYAETRTKANLARAQISLMLDNTAQARQELRQVLDDARRYELAVVEQQARALFVPA